MFYLDYDYMPEMSADMLQYTGWIDDCALPLDIISGMCTRHRLARNFIHRSRAGSRVVLRDLSDQIPKSKLNSSDRVSLAAGLFRRSRRLRIDRSCERSQ